MKQSTKSFGLPVVTKPSSGEFSFIPREVGGGWGCTHNEELDDAAQIGKGGRGGWMDGAES